MRTLCLFVGCACLIFVSTVALASLQEKKFIKDQEEKLENSRSTGIGDTNEYCGSTIKTSIDWESFKGASKPTWDEMVNANSGKGMKVAWNCHFAFAGIFRVCRDEDGKEAIQAIKTFTCHFGGEGERKLVATEGAEGAEGAIDYWIDFESNNNDQFVYEQLMNQL